MKSLQAKILSLALCLAMLLGLPANSWADADVVREVWDEARPSSIYDVKVEGRNLSFSYTVPKNDVPGKVYIWEITGLDSNNGLFTSKLPNSFGYDLGDQNPANPELLNRITGTFNQTINEVNLRDGKYLVVITSNNDRDYATKNLAAAQLLIDGKPVQSFDSTIVLADQDDDDLYFYTSVLSPSVLNQSNYSYSPGRYTVTVSKDGEYKDGKLYTISSEDNDFINYNFVKFKTSRLDKGENYAAELYSVDNDRDGTPVAEFSFIY
ncbi:hypothetical protein [Okeania sp. SIO2B3]|uniref:hypothetical protein n=1 Tax=Okeania sp. SIO2B3 TaxID=2607784 RepID=UPI0025D95BD1|nr:hypothetical protein [Okeania sp. SIO2B3]